MGSHTLEVCAGVEQMAETAARRWISALEKPPAAGGRRAIALCGGRAAASVFQCLARRGIANVGILSETEIFWADERCVPPVDLQSNFAETQRFLLQPLGIRQDAIHRIEGELPPLEAVARANAAVRQFVPRGPQGAPVFDFILLSMGEDGHVASLFPGPAESAAESASPYRFVLGAKTPAERITMSYAAIAGARRVLVLVSEADKAAALADSLSPGGDTPLARVIRKRTATELLTAFPVSPR